MKQFGLFLSVVLAFISSASAEIVTYSNVTTFTGFVAAPGGAVTNNTRMVFEDTTTVAAGELKRITWTVQNGNAAAVTVGIDVGIWDTVAGVPGNLLAAFSLSPVSINPGGFFFTLDNLHLTNNIMLPSGQLWMGLAFNNAGGTTGATAAQLNLFRQFLANPPTIGSSNDLFFRTTNPFGGFGNNPVGGLFFFGGNPVANFAWEVALVPEPTMLSLLSVAGLAFVGRLRRRR